MASIAILLFAGFAVFAVVRDQISIRENMQKYDELVSKTNEVNEDNEQINAYLEDPEKRKEYIENQARNKLDYANPDETIYYVIPAGQQPQTSEDNSTASE
ncbi:MAG: septum formation initiator family protein [Oscillospiraceae bacterium]|nr:septum formation initiator family protein [Oscillospiraceae bacterium]